MNVVHVTARPVLWDAVCDALRRGQEKQIRHVFKRFGVRDVMSCPPGIEIAVAQEVDRL